MKEHAQTCAPGLKANHSKAYRYSKKITRESRKVCTDGTQFDSCVDFVGKVEDLKGRKTESFRLRPLWYLKPYI